MLKPLLVSASLALAVIGGPSAAQQKSQSVQEQVALQGLPAYSAEGRQVGVVRQVRIGSNGQVEAVRIDLPKSPEVDAKTVQIPAAVLAEGRPHRAVVDGGRGGRSPRHEVVERGSRQAELMP
jgi:hypothetical protein